MNYRSCAAIVASAVFCQIFAAEDTLVYTFSKAASPGVISKSLAGAGTAMPMGGFQGLVNPALTSAATAGSGARGALAAGYGRDQVFDKLALPLGVVYNDGKGAMGFYYRFLNGGLGRVHDATVNFAGTLFEQIDQQGAVEFGLNLRYEHSDWRHDFGIDGGEAVNLRSQNLLLDIGFYQPHVWPGLDFSLVVTNLTGYMWTDIDGQENDDWINGRHRSVVVGVLYSIQLLSGNLIFQIPFDLEMANLFAKSLPNKYIVRAGADARIMQVCSVRFGYANAPENPLDLITDFDYDNLFYGGIGIFVKPFQLDFFAGKNEFGATVTYWY